jgi:hypothetical protein
MGKPSRDPGLDGALALYLIFYCAIAGCFGLVLYAFSLPTHNVNVGLAAYEPPAGTVVNYAAVTRMRPDQPVEPMAAAAEAEPETNGAAIETTGRAVTAAEDAKPPAKARKARRTAAKNTRRPDGYRSQARNYGRNDYAAQQ